VVLTGPLRLDPYLGYRFLVEIEGLIVGGFTDVDGLGAEVTTTPYKEGGLNDYEHQLPGPTTWPRLVLKRGLTDIDTLWSWHQDVRRGTIRRRNGSIVLGGESLAHGLHRWDFVGAYPVKWTGPTLSAGTASVAVEQVELVHRGIVRGSFL
jgi:phage tail-like protein